MRIPRDLSGQDLIRLLCRDWEYRVVHGLPQRPEFEQKLNQAGSEGFTIVSSTAMTLQPAELPETLVILKRRAR